MLQMQKNGNFFQECRGFPRHQTSHLFEVRPQRSGFQTGYSDGAHDSCVHFKSRDLFRMLTRGTSIARNALQGIFVMSSSLPPIPIPEVHDGGEHVPITEDDKYSESGTSGDDSRHYDLRNSEGRSCRLCETIHSILETACPTANWFVTSNAALRSRFTKGECGIAPGAVVLSVNQDCVNQDFPSVLRTCTFRTKLCSACEEEALKNDNKWHRRTGECCDNKCSNYESCDCYDDLPCVDYIYMPTCTRQNLLDDDMAVAVDEGRVLIVSTVQEQTMWIRETAIAAKDEAKDALRNEEPITLSELAEIVVCFEEELLVIAMYDQRLADFLDGNKSFTLSKVNGFVETSGRREVGPWLTGRLIKDENGQMWHVPSGKPVVLRTESNVSRVMEMKGEPQESDPLGTHII